MLLLPLGLSVYALGLGAASRYFFGKYLVYGHHPGILYLAGLVLSLCLCPWGAQTVYARFWSVLASFFTALTATLTAFLYLVMKRNYERYWFLVIVLAVCVGVPLLALAVTSPVLLFVYHMALALGRRYFPLLALEGLVFLGLCLFRIYGAYHPEYELMAFRAFGYWCISYSLTLLGLALSYYLHPHKPT